MRQHPPRCQARQGVARNRRPVRLASDNDNSVEWSATATTLDPWQELGEVASRLSRRWWADE